MQQLEIPFPQAEENRLILIMLQPPKTDPLIEQSKLINRKRYRV